MFETGWQCAKPLFGGEGGEGGVSGTKEVKGSGCDVSLGGQEQLPFALVKGMSATTKQAEV